MSEIDLDFYVWEKQSQTTTSLEEVYGYSVFSEEFDRKIKDYQKNQKSTREEALRMVWKGKKKDEIEDAFQSVLLAETDTVIKADYGTEQIQMMSNKTIAGFILCGMIFAGGILMLLEKQWRGKKNETDYNDIRRRYEEI